MLAQRRPSWHLTSDAQPLELCEQGVSAASEPLGRWDFVTAA